MASRCRSDDDDLDALARSEQDVVRALGLNKRVPVGGDDIHRRVVELQSQEQVGANVADPPELSLAGLDGDGRRKLAVQRDELLPVGLRVRDVLEQHHALLHVPQHGVPPSDAFDNDGTGEPGDELLTHEAVGMGMKPVQAGIVVVRDLDAILERLAGPNVREDVVSLRPGRNVKAVKMEIRRLLQTIVERHRQRIAGLEARDWRYVGIVVQHPLEPLAADHVLARRCRQVDVKLTVPPDEDRGAASGWPGAGSATASFETPLRS